jgi:hypothetical protein
VAFLDAIESEIAGAREHALRLGAAVVYDAAGASARDALREVVDSPVYAVGARSYAVLLPGRGRAEALGVLAKVEARCGARGTAVELERGETAVELAVRLLRGLSPKRPAPREGQAPNGASP